MDHICFVIMPFGGKFDEIYRKIYAPAICQAGLTPLRADEIYDNQAIFQDIRQSISDAFLILADVTGRNPNVNYELGIAHGLGKEVLITTSNPEDVPSDYRHIRYLRYSPGEIDWSTELYDSLVKTLKTVFSRLERNVSHGIFQGDLSDPSSGEMDSPIDPGSCSDLIAQANALGFEYQNDPRQPSHALLRYQDRLVMLDSREGPVSHWQAAAACLICREVDRFSQSLPHGHILRMRSAFFDLYAVHSFSIDYFYQRGELPMYTARELSARFYQEFDGQLFEGSIRYIAANFDHDRFDPDSDRYYAEGDPQTEIHNMVCFRNGVFVADIDRIFPSKNGKHYFYKLDGLLPMAKLGADSYAAGESHWLADWSHTKPRLKAEKTYSFLVTKVGPVENRYHVSNARNIGFTLVEQ